MADNRNQVAQAGKNGNGIKSSNNFRGNGDGEKRESPKERKMRLINEDNYWNVIKNKTPDTAEYVNLLNSNDDLIYRLRMTSFERNPNLSYDDLKEFLQRNNAIKEAINQLNIDLSKAVGREYRPPRGYSAHSVKQQQKSDGNKQNQQSQKTHATPVVQEMPAASA